MQLLTLCHNDIIIILVKRQTKDASKMKDDTIMLAAAAASITIILLMLLLLSGCASAPYCDEARAERDYNKQESKRMHEAYRNQAGKK